MIETSVFDKRLLSLKNCAFLGYYYRYDLTALISSLSVQEGTTVSTDLARWNTDTDGYTDIYKMWQAARFNANAIKWTNYYPNIHYPESIVTGIERYLRLTGVHRSWISRVDPGYYSPWHWDVDDNEADYLTKGPIKRYSIMLGEPTMGHIFVIGDDYLYNSPQGAIFKWNNYKDWHTGINAGMTPKYMLHILGY
jgi:hypothetical protein